MRIRIDKFLADMGIKTRAEIKEEIKKGMVQINGTTVLSPKEKADPAADNVFYRGSEVEYLEYVYYILNKPAGVLSATKDRQFQTVLDLLPKNAGKNLFPVGRLDKDTEGLLFITNDGMLAHDLLSPKKHVEKTYYFRTDSLLTQNAVDLIAQGIVIDEDFTALPGKLEILSAKEDGSEGLLTICEGKFHQVKRMMEAAGSRVVYLKRMRMGPLTLPPDLSPGDCRKLTPDEINMLKGFSHVC